MDGLDSGDAQVFRAVLYGGEPLLLHIISSGSGLIPTATGDHGEEEEDRSR